MADLATETDLVDRLGRALTAVEAAKAPAALSDASAKIRRYCRQQFAAAVGDEVVLRPVGSSLRIPQRPVSAVTQVEQIGTAGTVDRVMAAGEWAWDGIDLIELWPTPYAYDGIIASGTYANTYRVTYDHPDGAPDDIVAMTCSLVLRVLLAPSPIGDLVSERVGLYSYQYGQFPGGQSPGPVVKLTAEDKRELREGGYRRTAGTIQLRQT